ncbi:MAG: hypothetical protein K2J77_00045 [Oscillospiraceae bacterium]|nr:hypothetical protein [Oscillospiraceae bacterium]
MGLFGKKKQQDYLTLFFESEQYDSGDCAEILKQARLISRGDVEVMSAVEFAVRDPIKYIRDHAARFYERGIDIKNEDFGDEFLAYDLVYIAMVDELKARGYVSQVSPDYECEPDEFRAALSEIKGYEKIRDIVSDLDLDTEGVTANWTEQLNAALGGRSFGYSR